MAHATYKVHSLGESDSDKRIVRIRSEAFRDFQGKNFTIRIINTKGQSACFEAKYADAATYRSGIGGDDLVFMRKTWRDLLDVHPPENGRPSDQVEVEVISENDSLYEVHSASSDDHNEGRIYIFNEQLHDKIKGRRCIVRITRGDGKNVKPVYSEALYADDYYLKKWQDIWKARSTKHDFCKLIFISEWYRLLLGIHIGERINLKVDLLDPRKREGLWPLLYLYPRDHPQAVVRTASIMGYIGLGLGVIGIGLGIFSIQTLSQNFIPGPVIICIGLFSVLFGIFIALLGIIGLSTRR
jgi:hypothetical protein